MGRRWPAPQSLREPALPSPRLMVSPLRVGTPRDHAKFLQGLARVTSAHVQGQNVAACYCREDGKGSVAVLRRREKLEHW